MNVEEYIDSRINQQICWYDKKAIENKSLDHSSKCLIILFSASIPLFAGIEIYSELKNVILGSLGTLIAILTGISGLLKFHEKWTDYRATSEALKQEKILFQTKTGPYHEVDNEFKVLVERVENIISNENSSWSFYINKQN
jgi:hypothetical protein